MIVFIKSDLNEQLTYIHKNWLDRQTRKWTVHYRKHYQFTSWYFFPFIETVPIIKLIVVNCDASFCAIESMFTSYLHSQIKLSCILIHFHLKSYYAFEIYSDVQRSLCKINEELFEEKKDNCQWSLNIKNFCLRTQANRFILSQNGRSQAHLNLFSKLEGEMTLNSFCTFPKKIF